MYRQRVVGLLIMAMLASACTEASSTTPLRDVSDTGQRADGGETSDGSNPTPDARMPDVYDPGEPGPPAQQCTFEIPELVFERRVNTSGYLDQPSDRRSRLHGMATEGDFAYVGAGRDGLLVFDISDIRRPKFVSSLQIPFDGPNGEQPAWVEDFEVDDGFVYLAQEYGARSLWIVDVRSPAEPSVVTSLEIDWSSTENVMAADAGRLAMATTGNVVLYDTSTPSAPRPAGTVATEYEAESVAFHDDVLFVSEANSFDAAIDIFDVSDLDTPALISRLEGVSADTKVTFDGDVAYFFAWNHLTSVDLSDPTAPVVLDTIEIERGPKSVDIDGTTLFAASPLHGVSAIDISEPNSLLLHGRSPLPLMARGVAGREGIALVADTYRGMVAIDFSTLEGAPRLHASYDRRRDRQAATDMAVSDGWAYVTGLEDGVELWSVDPADAPTPMGTLPLDNGPTTQIETRGELAFVTGDRLSVIDISSPRQAKLLGESAPIPAAQDVVINGRYAFVSSLEGDLYVVDVANPRAPSAHSVVRGVPASRSMVLSDGYLYVAPTSRDESLEVLDIRNASEVDSVSLYELQHAISDIAITQGRLYLAEEDGLDLHILDARNPRDLRELRTLSSSNGQPRLTASEDYVYWSSESGGLFFVDARDPREFLGALAVDTDSFSAPGPVVVSNDLVYVENNYGLHIFNLCESTGLQP